jgi:DNA polymerase elongation subunit (family B)
MDFASLYPHMMCGGNLYSPIDTGNYWNGNTGPCVYPSKYSNEADGIFGKYSRTMGRVEKTINDLYQMRLSVTKKIETSEGQEKENFKSQRLAIKILINTIYGIMGSPKFKSVYTLVGAGDCTAMARRSIKHAIMVLKDYGYEILYGDTDSAYVRDPYNDIEQLKKVAKYIEEQQKKSMNIPIDTHCFEIETAIKRMYFFKDDKGEFIKKHYIYVTAEDKLVIKGLTVVKGNCSPLTIKVFEEHIKPKMLENRYKPFQPEQLLAIFRKMAKEDPSLLIKRYRTKPVETYKTPEGKDEATCIGYQISKRYGPGEHWMIPNKRIGVGKNDDGKIAPLSELQGKYGDDWIKQVRFGVYLSELKDFIPWEERKEIAKINKRRET